MMFYGECEECGGELFLAITHSCDPLVEARKEASKAGVDWFLPEDWYRDRNTLVLLARDLEYRGEIRTALEAIRVFDEPWNYRRQVVRMLTEGALEEAG